VKAVVTGASSGIGRALSVELVKHGFEVLGAARNEQALQALQEELGQRFRYVVANLSKLEGVERVAQAARELGSVDVLVNNAGFGLYKRLLDHTDEELADMIMVNCVAPIALVRKLVPLMRRGSVVVNVVTAGVHVLMTKLPAYGASKIALHYATEALRRELKPLGIRVVAVYPGYIATAFHERAGGTPSRVKPIQPERVAEAVVKAVLSGKERVYIPGYAAFLRVFGPHLLPLS
jgi:hypothetical protein